MSGNRDTRLAASPQGTGFEVRHGPRDRRAVALTFDDGRDPVVVRDLLAVLAAGHAQATFFPQANAMTADPGAWRAVASAGHPVGNHTVSHPHLPEYGAADIRAEIAGFRALADPILGVRSLPWFRPPYGGWDERVARIAAECGYPRILLWDIDARDWDDAPPAAIARRALEGYAGSIVLMHAGPRRTLEALPAVIAGYRARGLALVSIPELLAGAD